MIDKILRGLVPYDNHGDTTGRAVLIIEPSRFGPEITVNIGWTNDEQGGYEISEFPEERPFLPLPTTLSVVRTADLDAANARIKELEAQVAEMPILDPNQQVVFESEDGAQIIERDIDGQFWISEPWNNDDPGYPLSVPLPKGLTIITFALGTVVGESHDTHPTPNQ